MLPTAISHVIRYMEQTPKYLTPRFVNFRNKVGRDILRSINENEELHKEVDTKEMRLFCFDF